MQTQSQDLDQLLLDKYSCYCLFGMDEAGQLLFSGNLKANDEAVKNMAFLYSQLQYDNAIIESLKKILKRMTTEEMDIFTKLLINYKKRENSKPVIQPINNVQKA